MLPNFLDRSKLPHKSGVYIFKDKRGDVIYVGKAIELYHRVASYFSNSRSSYGNIKSKAMILEIASLETIVVESELEALILEANLIKKCRPPFNVRLTDDKDYLYIAITREFFPKVITARKPDLEKTEKYWGPFPSSRNVWDTLKQLRKVFPWCSNPCYRKTRFRPCFYYHLGLCPGACVGLINKQDYGKIINRFSKFMDGKKRKLVSELTLDMMRLSDEQMFEQALKIKRMLQGIAYLTQPNRTDLYLQNPNFLQEEKQLALKQLQTDLNLPKLPHRIEGYDISNIAGKEAVGSMVVISSGEIDKSQYRKFRIRMNSKPNDTGMMGEIIRRRLNHKEWPTPDLIIVDGGKGQARAVKFGIPVFGLAKRMEWLYPPEGEIIKLSRKSLSLKLLQKLRDEAHRFAISYHRKLRDTIITG
ncbi:GIY-YIG nuclease family protein [Candidatus Daviesbacteria bacterium]|nr:GIY-YIG nuclease family protein [Candidatus Daviesbacteria bacterium]